VSVLLHEANAIYIYGGTGCAGAINLPLVKDDRLMWPHDKWDMQRGNGLVFRHMV